MSSSVRTARRVLVYALLCLIVGGQAFDVAQGREHWPFSPYAMYSRLNRSRTLCSTRVVWVTDEPRPRELEWRATHERAPFVDLVRHRHENRDKILQRMRDRLRHERRRRAEHHARTQVRGLRVYELTFRMSTRLQGPPKPQRSRVLFDVEI